MSRNVIASAACWALFAGCASLSQADESAVARAPLGVYAKIDIANAIGGYTAPSSPSAAKMHSYDLHAYLRKLYAGLLANPAISGITVGAHWDDIQISNGVYFYGYPEGYDWSYLDDAFAEANSAQKSVQLIITPGFDTPQWLLTRIPPCDGLFPIGTGTAPADCGTIVFTDFPQLQHSDGTVLPLPWNSIYQQAWGNFLTHLNARYNAYPTFVSIAVAGPVGPSTEIILPTTDNDPAIQPSGMSANDTWAALIKHSFPNNSSYQNTDQVFIDTWKQAIDLYENIFSGVTLSVSADSGNDLPKFGGKVTPHADNTLYAKDCADAIAGTASDLMPCEAKAEILSYFVTVAGPNAKATRVGGLTASSQKLPGNIGIAGVKLLTALSPAPSPSFLGGAQFDHPVSGPNNLQVEGCADPSGNCPGLTPEEAAYNVLTVFFYGTPAATFYAATTGTATMHYLEVPYEDVQYAQAHPCPASSSAIIGKMSLQDLLSRASHDLFAMAGQQTALTSPTCS